MVKLVKELKEQVIKVHFTMLVIKPMVQVTKVVKAIKELKVKLVEGVLKSSNFHLIVQQVIMDLIGTAKTIMDSITVKLTRIMRSPKDFIIPITEVIP